MKTYKISKGHWQADIAPCFGGNIVSLKYKDSDVFVPLITKEQLKENPFIQGSPILIPANRTKGGKFTFKGKEYTLPVNEPNSGANLHGLVHLQAFEVISQTDSEIVLKYVNRGESYPFAFDIKVSYSIKEDSFVQSYAVKNIGDTDMPLTFALHTTFVEPECFSVPIEYCQQRDEFNLPTGKYVPLSESEKAYVSGSPSKGVTISGYYSSCGNTAVVGKYTYTVSDEFDHWVLFNGKGSSNLLCIEPQCGSVDGLNSQNGHKIIKSGKSLNLFTSIKHI